MTHSASILSKHDPVTLSWHSGAQQVWWQHPTKSNLMSPSISMLESSNKILLGKNTYYLIEYKVSSSSSSGCSSTASCVVAVQELDLAQGKIQTTWR